MFTVKQAANTIGVTPKTILHYIDVGILRGTTLYIGAKKRYIVDEKSVDSFLKKHPQGPR